MGILSDKILRTNFSYLFFLQIANYLIPLLLLPYIGTVLGASNFGKIMFVQAFIAYFILFVDFGFNVSATKAIVENREDKSKMSAVFWDTMLAKGAIFLLCFIFLLGLVFGLDKFQKDYELFFIGYISVLSSFLFPLWLFQGLEKMKEVTIVNVVPKLLMLFFTFYFVNDSNDYTLALLIQMLALLFSALMSLFIVYQKRYVYFIKPTIKGAIEQIRNSWHIFLTSLSTNLYTTTNIVVLGLLTNDAIVGVYSAADKLIRALISFISSVMQVVFPRVNVYYRESSDKAINFVKRLIAVVAIGCILLAFVILGGAEFIIQKMYSSGDFEKTVDVFRYSSLLPLFSVVNGLLAINVLVVFGLRKSLSKIVFIGCLFSLILISPLVSKFQEIGAVICATLTEILIFILLIITIIRHKIQLFTLRK